MFLFVDETECPEYFIVTGLLVNSRQDIELAYKRFKKKVDNIKISPKKKAILFTEFKSTLMDKHYQKAKTDMLLELNVFAHCAIFSCHTKKESKFIQEDKENVYITLITKIIEAIPQDVDVVFDGFNKKDFEDRIVSNLQLLNNVTSARAADSQTEAGLKYVDNICSVIRLRKTEQDNYHFFNLIEKWVKEI